TRYPGPVSMRSSHTPLPTGWQFAEEAALQPVGARLDGRVIDRVLHRIEPVPVRDPGVRCLVMEELERLGHGVLSFINDKRSALPEPPSGYNARRMEAERINQIASTLTDLQARSAALRRYL